MGIETIGAIILNAAVYASLAAGAVRWNRQRPPRPADAVEAFHFLETALRRSFPDLSEGFTLREGLARARLAGLVLSWDGIDQDLTKYEAYRYGSGQAPTLPMPEVMSLLNALWRRR